MVTVAIYEAHHGRSKQAIKLRAAFMRRHAIGVQGIGAFHRYFARNQRCPYRRKASAGVSVGHAI
jgi:hypothetical protein